MTLKVLHGIASDIAESGYYSITADESTDASNIEQPLIYMLDVDKEMTVCEEYIGLMQSLRQTRYNCFHQRCAAEDESWNSRCSWAVL